MDLFEELTKATKPINQNKIIKKMEKISINPRKGSTKNAHKFKNTEQTEHVHVTEFLKAYKYATRNRKDFCCGEKMKFIEEFGTIEHDKSAGDIFHADGYLARCELCNKGRKINY